MCFIIILKLSSKFLMCVRMIKNALICYIICRSPLAQQFLSYFCPMPALYPKSPDFMPMHLFCLPLFQQHTWPGNRILFPVRSQGYCTRWRNEGGEGGVMQVVKTFWCVCVQNDSGAWFIVPRQGPILGPSPVPSPAGDWGYGICGSCGSTTCQPRLLYSCWPSHVILKGFL